MGYTYWDNFISNWQNQQSASSNPLPSILASTSISGWTFPRGLLNSSAPLDFSTDYLPEPWWGNDGNSPLESVVVNYNPGKGAVHQHFSQITNSLNYSKFVSHQVSNFHVPFKTTNAWHKSRRATRIFDTLNRLGILGNQNTLDNHLSIELIPWHTANTKSIRPYIQSNLLSVYKNSLIFAANESKRIMNKKLKSKVLVRMSGSKVTALLNSFNKINISSKITAQGKCTSGTGAYLRFGFSQIPGVEFIAVWGGKTHNDFPSNNDMDEIFKLI